MKKGKKKDGRTNQSATRNTDPIPRIPRRDAAGLLGTGVEHGSNQHKGRVGYGLECARQDAQSQQPREIDGRRLSHQKSAPHEDVEREIVGRRASLHDEVGRDGPDEPAKVEARGQPGILLPF